MISIPKHLKSIFEQELLKELSELEIVRFSANSTLLRSGSYIKVIPIVLKGKIKVIRKDNSEKEILLYHIEPNESCILSITSSINNKKSKVDAITEEDSDIILVPASKVKEWMEKYSGWRKFLMSLYHERLTELLGIVDEVAFKNMDFRLIERLKEKQKPNSQEIEITHQKLADELGTAREVVSRLLKKLENDGKIKLLRGKIKIITPL
ncbi:MAG: Crp/Fnr family transcriptional regulator [Bacteroidetes bacterium]|nr:MAG: Crp/Fnr family transcriptional regulator [Bacteroidota bacterium]